MPNNDTHACDFCGRPVAIALERLLDGRERCSPCEVIAVDTLDELVGIYREARRFLTEEIGITLREAIRVIYCTPDEIAKYHGASFSPTQHFDVRPMGLAIFDGCDCIILIENEQPRHMALATAIHELVHVWQFDNLDLEFLEHQGQFFLVEGLALWAEIECLKRRNIAAEYRLMHEERGDASGEGLRAIQAGWSVGPREGSPFDDLSLIAGKRR